MSENNRDIVLSSNDDLSKYSSSIVKKGLDLLKELNNQNQFLEKSEISDQKWKCLYSFPSDHRDYGDQCHIFHVGIDDNNEIIAIIDNLKNVIKYNLTQGKIIEKNQLLAKKIFNWSQSRLLSFKPKSNIG